MENTLQKSEQKTWPWILLLVGIILGAWWWGNTFASGTCSKAPDYRECLERIEYFNDTHPGPAY